jgi:hypothetical protein
MAQYIGKQEKKTEEQRKQGKTEEWLKNTTPTVTCMLSHQLP